MSSVVFLSLIISGCVEFYAEICYHYLEKGQRYNLFLAVVVLQSLFVHVSMCLSVAASLSV